MKLPIGLASPGRALALAASGSAAGRGVAGPAEPAGFAQARQIVPATANIFGAGYATAPAPGGGGAGTMPPVWRLPEGSARVVSFPLVTGRVTPVDSMAPYNGPGGNGRGRRYEVPAEATRLFLGFADGYGYEGPPGWYGNNAGKLEVDVAGTLAVPAPALGQAALGELLPARAHAGRLLRDGLERQHGQGPVHGHRQETSIGEEEA